MAAESKFQKKVIDYLKSLGDQVWYKKIWGGGFQSAGIPDILLCCRGHFIAIELKAPNGKASELQKYNLEKIQKAGGSAFILYPKDFEDFKKFMNDVIEL